MQRKHCSELMHVMLWGHIDRQIGEPTERIAHSLFSKQSLGRLDALAMRSETQISSPAVEKRAELCVMWLSWWDI